MSTSLSSPLTMLLVMLLQAIKVLFQNFCFNIPNGGWTMDYSTTIIMRLLQRKNSICNHASVADGK